MHPKFLKWKAHNELKEKDLIRMHHVFMKEYGWIPLEEFRNLPIPTFWNLANQFMEDNKEYERKMSLAKGKQYGNYR